jgi:cell division protein FtsQ
VSRSGLTTRDRTRGPRRSTERGATTATPLPERRRPRRNSRRRRIVRIAVGVVVLALGFWLVWAGPVLAVSTVQVDGVSILPAEQVREAAGIAAGTPLLQVDVDAAEARVAALPQVASVEVTRGWPQSVVITVVERVPVAVVGEPGSRSLVDAEGVLFDSVSGDAPAGVVQLVVDDPGPGDPATRAALTAIRALPRDLLERVAGVAAPSPEDLSLALTDGTLVEWGSAEESPAKASALAALVEKIASGALEPAETIDVTAPEAVVLR